MADNANLLQVIKQAAVEAVEADTPTRIMFGTIESTSPLKVNVEQKMTLTKEFLILTHNVIDYDVDMTVDHSTDTTYMNANHTHVATADSKTTVKNTVTNTLKTNKEDTTIEGDIKVKSTATSDTEVTVEGVSIPLSHSHTYTGRKKFRVHNALKKGDSVILLQVQGGQKFIILDKVVKA